MQSLFLQFTNALFVYDIIVIITVLIFLEYVTLITLSTASML